MDLNWRMGVRLSTCQIKTGNSWRLANYVSIRKEEVIILMVSGGGGGLSEEELSLRASLVYKAKYLIQNGSELTNGCMTQYLQD